MAILDPKTNFGKTKVIGTYSSTATQITVENVSRLPATTGYNIVWWDGENYPDPSDDPNREIVRVTGIGGSILTLESSGGNRVAQEGTTATTKETAGATYYVANCWTKRDVDAIEQVGIDVGEKYTWITEHGAVGDGVEDDKDAFDAAVTDGKTYIVCPYGTWRIASNLTLSNSIVLVCLPGCTLAPASGVTLTIQGDVIAGNYQIFGGTGTVTLTDRCALRYVRWDGTDSDDLRLRGARYSVPAIVESGDIDVSTTGVKTVQIAHGLASTPDAKRVTLSMRRTSGSNNPDVNQLMVQSVDGTNINAYLYVTGAAATTVVRVVAYVHPIIP